MVTGTIGFYVLSGFKAGFVDCLYMTVITLSTIGFSEIIIVEDMGILRLFTMYLIVVGLSNLLLVLSSLANYFAAGNIQRLLERRKIVAQIKSCHQHIIVCGGGRTAEHILRELEMRKKDVVLVEKRSDRCDFFSEQFKHSIIIHGDATEDGILIKAGIKKASVLVAVLPNDKDNLLCTISAKFLNTDCRIVSKTLNLDHQDKLLRAGATSVVPNRYIGALRVVSEVLSPNVVSFLDSMMRTTTYRIVEVMVKNASPFCGQSLKKMMDDSQIEENVISFKYETESVINYNPKLSDQIQANMSLFFITDPQNLSVLEKKINQV